MRSLEALRDKIKRDSVATLDFHGQQLAFQKIDLQDGRRLFPRLIEMQQAKDGAAPEAVIDFHVDFLCATLVDNEMFEKDCQNDESRAIIAGLPLQDILELAGFSLEHTGWVPAGWAKLVSESVTLAAVPPVGPVIEDAKKN